MYPSKDEAEAWSNLSNEMLNRAKEISMLGTPALALLSKLAGVREGPTIEIGPYIGGSTIALASGTHDRVVTVELGGDKLDHETIQSADIIRDLTQNIAKAGFADRVCVIQGHFRSSRVFAAVQRALNGRQADLLFVDVHPGTEIALGLYARLLTDNAFIIVDDYRSEIEHEKAALVSHFVNQAIAEGTLQEIGVFGWGTWFGALTGNGRRKLMLSPTPMPCVHEIGHCWVIDVGHAECADDRNANTSPLLLFEDHVPIGPAHCLHEEIRQKGAGRFSHWQGHLWFSSSDNTNPQSNGRQYTARIGDVEIDLGRGLLP